MPQELLSSVHPPGSVLALQASLSLFRRCLSIEVLYLPGVWMLAVRVSCCVRGHDKVDVLCTVFNPTYCIVTVKYSFAIYYYAVSWIRCSSWRELADSCECGNEPSGSIKCWGFLD